MQEFFFPCSLNPGLSEESSFTVGEMDAADLGFMV
jgi:hypothetical protein